MFYMCIHIQTGLPCLLNALKNPMQEMRIWSPCWEDPREEEKDNLLKDSCLKNPLEEPDGLQSKVSQWVGHDWATKHHTYINIYIYIYIYSFTEIVAYHSTALYLHFF